MTAAFSGRIFWLIFLCSIGIVAATNLYNPVKSSEYKRVLIAPPSSIKYLHFGYNEQIADLLWIRAVQDFDYCEAEERKGICQRNSWLFRMLDAALTLSPHFEILAKTGGLALTVLISDFEGATLFFDRAVKNFPRTWQILYYAAYHAIYEEKDKVKAANYLREAAKYGGNEWFNILAVRLYTDAGKKELGISIYESLKGTNFPKGFLKRMEDKLAEGPVEESKKPILPGNQKTTGE